MDVQATPSPYASLGAPQPPAGNPPALGQQVPGHSGGLPAQGGLSVLANPLAQELQSAQPQQAAQHAQQYGRGDDTMLVHMTPDEVNSLQSLAMASGGSLTINPHTGLPEAGWLGKLLPMLAGIGLNFILPGSGIVASLGGKAATAGLLTAAGTTAITGDLQKGLMAGLGAFGGASLAGGIQGAIGGAAKGAATATTAPASTAVTQAGEKLATQQAGQLANIGKEVGKLSFKGTGLGGLGGGSTMGMGANVVAPELVRDVAPTMVKGLGGFTQGFANAAKGTMGGMLGKAAVPLAISGVAGSFGSSGGTKNAQGQIDNSYQGPYTAQRRTATFAPSTEDLLASTKERKYFDVDMPEIYNMQGQVVQPGSQTAPGTPILQSYLLPTPKKKDGSPMYGFREVPYMQPGFARGGEVELADGAFVVDARTVSELGNGSSGAGQELLARMGGRPVQGPGDGVSDSVPARIGRDQPARVARDEVIFDPMAVRRIGGGDERRGASKLYAMMDKAHAARKRAERGTDTKLRKGLA